jgi:hypothetical protein
MLLQREGVYVQWSIVELARRIQPYDCELGLESRVSIIPVIE